jgi:osmotically-inducible protein OsmY
MTSQDYRIQENRYRQDDFADDPRRERYEDARRYQGGRREYQGQVGYGRGREFGLRDDYGRQGEYFGRRPGDLPNYGRPSEEEYPADDNQLAGPSHYDRGGSPRSYGNRDVEGFGNRWAGSYQGGIYRGNVREYGANRSQFIPDYADYERDAYLHGGVGTRQPRAYWNRVDAESWPADQYRDEHARYHGVGPKNYKRSDERIREDVSDYLSDDPYVNASEIEVNVQNSEVTLTGTVENRIQRRRAEIAAEQVSGVSHVQNNLRVKDAAHGVHQAAERNPSGASEAAPRIASQNR